MTIVLMAIFTALNFLAMRLFTKVNAGITWWKVAIPVLTIIVLLFKFHGSNFQLGRRLHPQGSHWKDLFAAIPGAGIVFAYLGFEQADQLAAEIKNPQRNLPRAIMLAIVIGIVIYVMLQVVFIGAMKPSILVAQAAWARLPVLGDLPLRDQQHRRRAVRRAWPASSGLAGWPSSCGSTRSSPRSAPA